MIYRRSSQIQLNEVSDEKDVGTQYDSSSCSIGHAFRQDFCRQSATMIPMASSFVKVPDPPFLGKRDSTALVQLVGETPKAKEALKNVEEVSSCRGHLFCLFT